MEKMKMFTLSRNYFPKRKGKQHALSSSSFNIEENRRKSFGALVEENNIQSDPSLKIQTLSPNSEDFQGVIPQERPPNKRKQSVKNLFEEIQPNSDKHNSNTNPTTDSLYTESREDVGQLSYTQSSPLPGGDDELQKNQFSKNMLNERLSNPVSPRMSLSSLDKKDKLLSPRKSSLPSKQWFTSFLPKTKPQSKKESGRETVYVSCFEDLPRDCQKQIKASKISTEEAKTHFKQLLIVLSFVNKKNYKILRNNEVEDIEPKMDEKEKKDLCEQMNSKVFEKHPYENRIKRYNHYLSSQTTQKEPTLNQSHDVEEENNENMDCSLSNLEKKSDDLKEEENTSNSIQEKPLKDLAKESLDINESALPQDPGRVGGRLVEKNAQKNLKKKFKVIQESGHGGFGKVFEAKDITNQNRVAIKKMLHYEKKDIRSNNVEVGVLASAKHPNIVSFRDAFTVANEIWIVMEFMEGGTLTQATEGCSFQEEHISYVAREILRGIAYLHRNNVLHRDLKSGNVMMSITGEIKLIDFGLCCSVFSGIRRKMAGSPYWMPPEMVQRKPYGFPIDIWSFGICLLEMANRSPPNNVPKLAAMFRIATSNKPSSLETPEKWSSQMNDFFDKILQPDPIERPAAYQLLEHPFIEKAQNCLDMDQILKTVFMHTALKLLEM